MSWVRPTARNCSIWDATARPLARALDGLAMSCGRPPEQDRLNRCWMPLSPARSSEALADRWQK